MADGFNTGPSTLGFSWTAPGAQRLPDDQRAPPARPGCHPARLRRAQRVESFTTPRPPRPPSSGPSRSARAGNRWPSADSAWRLVTRYALAKMEHEGSDHQTGLYWSYDSPHRAPDPDRPPGLRATTHDPRRPLLNQINSPPPRSCCWQHITEWDSPHEESKLRLDFLAALEQVGGWPRRPR